ncbi:hypothetical protein CL621_00690 [archaeon]|nr:hypothetical protein [archaeon]
MELGGNISLEGFDELEPGTLIVVKKMVGNYAKSIAEKAEFEKLELTLKEEEKKYKIEVKLISKGKEKKEEAEDENMFFAIDKALGKFK